MHTVLLDSLNNDNKGAVSEEEVAALDQSIECRSVEWKFNFREWV